MEHSESAAKRGSRIGQPDTAEHWRSRGILRQFGRDIEAALHSKAPLTGA
jgi:hypothetical protein